MKDRINILFIIDHFHLAGGTEKHLSYLVRHLDRTKFKCMIVVFDFGHNPLSNKIEASGVPIVHIPVYRYYTLNALIKGLELFRLIKKNNIDLVQTFHIKSDFYGALIAKLSGVKCIVSSKRDTGDLKSRWHFFLNRRVKNLFSGFIAVADAVKDQIVVTEHIKREKITTIHNGVNLGKFAVPDEEKRMQIRRKFGYSESDFIIGTVAWFRPEKCYDVFFEAIDLVRQSAGNVKAVVVGGGQQLDYYKNKINNTALSDHVLFTGLVDNVSEYINLFDVACLVPGKNEGFSNSILEKMAMGLPLVVTDVGGNSESVLDGFNGFVIPPGDSSALSQSILELYRDPEKRRLMGKRSRQRVEEHFTIFKMIKDHEKYYESFFNSC
ncbi:MAG: glycosyltransferase [Desulfobacteraceae bacterium]|nr:MAG: glycosyltransferase [Desulfobacteraceae bacterium]